MSLHFIAFSSNDTTHAETIASAGVAASSSDVTYRSWSREDASGSALGSTVELWIDDSEAVVADITFINHNVTYEIGYAIGGQKGLRLIRNSTVPLNELKAIGLFDTILHNEFRTQPDLEQILRNRPANANTFRLQPKNRAQAVFVLAPPLPTPFSTKLLSAIKKQARQKFRSYNAREVARLTAMEAWEQVGASFGLVVTWQEANDLESRRNNQRAMLLFGMARGLDVPALLLAHTRAQLPSDVADQATRFTSDDELSEIFREFRDDVQDALNDYADAPELPLALLDKINCGNSAAENEQDHLSDYFLATQQFKSAIDGATNLIVGRKGSGKTAIALQVRDRIRADKRNIVVDLNPEGYQLVKLKELIQALTSRGVRKEFIAAFWQYVLWLEIAYKLLEKDSKTARRDGALHVKYEKLKAAFESRVDTGSGDFSERLRLLTDTIASRFTEQSNGLDALKSSQVLKIVYGTDIATIREEILSYLKLKGIIVFLFDNLDRMRTPGGFDDDDALITLGLVESLQDITKAFRRDKFEFRWLVFVRSDVYEFVVRSMPDYSKHSQLSLEWQDGELLIRILKLRIAASLGRQLQEFDTIWSEISVPMVFGRAALVFLAEASLMRPRYLIRLFESAKRRAINLDHQRITQEDYGAALDELGWTIIEDLNLELRDIVPNAENLLFDLAPLNGACGLTELNELLKARIGATDAIKRATDVLLWSGAVGLIQGASQHYIYTCGYKLGFLHALMNANPHIEVCLHPTVARLLSPESVGTSNLSYRPM